MALPSGPITRAHANKLQAALNIYIQEQVTMELQESNFARYDQKLEDTPKWILWLEMYGVEAAH